jgi:hypothetical protein
MKNYVYALAAKVRHLIKLFIGGGFPRPSCLPAYKITLPLEEDQFVRDARRIFFLFFCPLFLSLPLSLSLSLILVIPSQRPRAGITNRPIRNVFSVSVKLGATEGQKGRDYNGARASRIPSLIVKSGRLSSDRRTIE